MVDLKEALHENRFTRGTWLTLGHSGVAEVVCQAGFDWITVDMEHSAITLPQAQELIRVIDLHGTVPLVRVGENNADHIKRVMDAGARGVIVAMINSAADARTAVAAVKYPPQGRRGVGLARAQGYGFAFNEYRRWVEEHSVVIAQIEHIHAIENLEAILDTPGIDGTIIGPYDLSGSLGFPGEFDRADVQAAVARYEETCRRMHKPMGCHVVEPDAVKAATFKQKGYTFLALGLDTLYLGSKCREVLSALPT